MRRASSSDRTASGRWPTFTAPRRRQARKLLFSETKRLAFFPFSRDQREFRCNAPLLKEKQMVAHPKPCYVTPEEYLERERAAETKSEYYDGVIVAMAGASPEHDRIAVDILRHLGNQLERSPCEPFSSDMRVRVPTCNRYYYPDVSVACGGSQFEALVGVRSLLNPKLIVEVLSESTEKNDRTDKYDCYRTL